LRKVVADLRGKEFEAGMDVDGVMEKYRLDGVK